MELKKSQTGSRGRDTKTLNRLVPHPCVVNKNSGEIP